MSYIPMRPLLESADKHGYANGAFNMNAYNQVEAALRIHNILRAPAILQGAELANGFMGGKIDFFKSSYEDKTAGAKNLVDCLNKLLKKYDVPVCLHLDHGKSFEVVKAFVDIGYSSVMIDGSDLPLKENIELTREVVKYAHQYGVTVEGELGVLAGTEDLIQSNHSTYTNPLDAIKFFKETKVDALAISYGTKHGANKGSNSLIRKEIAIAIKECMRHENIEGFLVSHGSSLVPSYIVNEINQLGGDINNAHGISLEQLKEVIHSGINKINIDTDIRLAVTRNVRELFYRNELLKSKLSSVWSLLDSNPKSFDPRYFMSPLIDILINGNNENSEKKLVIEEMEKGVEEILATLIVEFGTVGKKSLVEEVTLEQMADRYKKEGI